MKGKRNGQIPNKLKEYRESHGFSQQDVAEMLDLKNALTVDRWENGDAFPDGASFLKLLALYETDETRLYGEYIKKAKRKLEDRMKRLKQKDQRRSSFFS